MSSYVIHLGDRCTERGRFNAQRWSTIRKTAWRRQPLSWVNTPSGPSDSQRLLLYKVRKLGYPDINLEAPYLE